MDARVEAALAAVADRLEAAGVPFLVGGGALLCALGLVDDVGDLDLMFRGSDYDALRRAAGGWWRTSTTTGSDLWASEWFATLEVGGVGIDAIGGMAFRHPAGVARLPFRSGTVIELDGRRVALAPPELWWAVYRAYRPERATLLEQVVSADARRRTITELGLGS